LLRLTRLGWVSWYRIQDCPPVKGLRSSAALVRLPEAVTKVAQRPLACVLWNQTTAVCHNVGVTATSIAKVPHRSGLLVPTCFLELMVLIRVQGTRVLCRLEACPR